MELDPGSSANTWDGGVCDISYCCYVLSGSKSLSSCSRWFQFFPGGSNMFQMSIYTCFLELFSFFPVQPDKSVKLTADSVIVMDMFRATTNPIGLV